MLANKYLTPLETFRSIILCILVFFGFELVPPMFVATIFV